MDRRLLERSGRATKLDLALLGLALAVARCVAVLALLPLTISENNLPFSIKAPAEIRRLPDPSQNCGTPHQAGTISCKLNHGAIRSCEAVTMASWPFSTLMGWSKR